LTEGLAKGNDGDFARCAARELVRKPGAVALVLKIGDKQPTTAKGEQIRPLVLAAEAVCHEDFDAGLP